MGILERLSQRLASLVDDVALPDALRERVELGAAFLARGDLAAATTELEAVLEERPEYARAWRLLGLVRWRAGDRPGAAQALAQAGDAEALVALGDVRRELGDRDGAQSALKEALAQAPPPPVLAEAFRSLGGLHLESGRPDKAVRELRKAAAAAPKLAEVHALLGEAYAALGDRARARTALRKAVALEEEAAGSEDAGARAAAGVRPTSYVLLGELLLEAAGGAAPLAAGIPVPGATGTPDLLGEAERVLAHALAQPRLEPPLARRGRIALGRLQLRRRDLGAAHESALRALGLDPQDRAALTLLADVHEGAGNLEAALDLRQRLGEPALELALRLGHPAVLGRQAELALLRDPADPLALAARRLAEEPLPAPPADLGALLRQTHRLFLARPELGSLAADAGRLVESLDRPLLVAVMGEFNTGKSTFVNALLGQEVAPMGVTPTTATLNLLKYGHAPGARVVYRDDRSREVPWDEVPALLRRLEPAEARAIRVVEVLYPAEALQRVNVVDTPGLNSIIPEHEELAREFIGQADAVVWLFAVGQAGKRTEAEALARVRAEGKRALGVLNKIDRVSEAELEKVLAHLGEGLGDLLETIVPVSAKQALAGQGGRFDELRKTLEERFFSRAREILRAAARERLNRLLERARAQLPTPPGPRDEERSRLAERSRRFREEFLPGERVRVRAQAEAALHAAAREVLEFVRPRAWVFGQNEAHPADRDFLLEVLSETIDALCDGSRARALAELGADAAPLLDGRVYGPLRAFARGFLRGGRVDAFFTRTLPRMGLEEPTIFRALLGDAPDLEEWLVLPLGAAAQAHFEALRQATLWSDRTDRAAALMLELALTRPLEALAQGLASLPPPAGT